MTEHRLAPTYRFISSHLPMYGQGFGGLRVIAACACGATRPVDGYGGWWAWHLAHALDEANLSERESRFRWAEEAAHLESEWTDTKQRQMLVEYELIQFHASAVVLPEGAADRIADAVHDALCMCRGTQTGITLRSRDWDLMRAALAPLLESWRPTATTLAERLTIAARVEPVSDLAAFHTLSLTEDEAKRFDADVMSARGTGTEGIKALDREASTVGTVLDAPISAGAVTQPSQVDREALLDVLKTADADYQHGYRPTAYLEYVADRLIAAGTIADVPTEPAESLERVGLIARELGVTP